MHARHLLASAALAATLATNAAHAAFINGGISFSDGFESYDTTTSIVSQLTFVDVDNSVLAQSCTGDFGSGACSPNLGAFASDFTIGGFGELIFTWNGFTFVVDQFLSVVRTALTCDGETNQCSDSLKFVGRGSVTGGGFDATGMLVTWTGQGGCTGFSLLVPTCFANVTASWSASVTATGQAPIVIPEPKGLALLGLAAALMGLVRIRSRAGAR